MDSWLRDSIPFSQLGLAGPSGTVEPDDLLSLILAEPGFGVDAAKLKMRGVDASSIAALGEHCFAPAERPKVMSDESGHSHVASGSDVEEGASEMMVAQPWPTCVTSSGLVCSRQDGLQGWDPLRRDVVEVFVFAWGAHGDNTRTLGPALS